MQAPLQYESHQICWYFWAACRGFPLRGCKTPLCKRLAYRQQIWHIQTAATVLDVFVCLFLSDQLLLWVVTGNSLYWLTGLTSV